MADTQAAVQIISQSLASDAELRKQIERLENIVRALLQLWPSDKDLPDFVLQLINTDAPSAMKATSLCQTNSTTDQGEGNGQPSSTSNHTQLQGEDSRLNEDRATLSEPANVDPNNMFTGGIDPWHWDFSLYDFLAKSPRNESWHG